MNLKCIHCKCNLSTNHKFDVDGYPICDACWQAEEEDLKRCEIRHK